MITCTDCGQEVGRKSTGRPPGRCSNCARERAMIQDRARHAKNRAERPVPTFICIDCGVKGERTSSTQKRCASCGQAAQIERDSKRHAANRKANAERTAAWRDRNPEASAEAAARYMERNRRSVIERSAKWRADNPHLMREKRRREIARDSSIDASRLRCPWTDAEDAVVKAWEEGLRELGAALGRTKDSVKRRRAQLRKRAAEQSADNEGLKP